MASPTLRKKSFPCTEFKASITGNPSAASRQMFWPEMSPPQANLTCCSRNPRSETVQGNGSSKPKARQNKTKTNRSYTAVQT